MARTIDVVIGVRVAHHRVGPSIRLLRFERCPGCGWQGASLSMERLSQVDRKPVRRYVAAAEQPGLGRDGDDAQLSDVLVGLVVTTVVDAMLTRMSAASLSLSLSTGSNRTTIARRPGTRLANGLAYRASPDDVAIFATTCTSVSTWRWMCPRSLDPAPWRARQDLLRSIRPAGDQGDHWEDQTRDL